MFVFWNNDETCSCKSQETNTKAQSEMILLGVVNSKKFAVKFFPKSNWSIKHCLFELNLEQHRRPESQRMWNQPYTQLFFDRHAHLED